MGRRNITKAEEDRAENLSQALRATLPGVISGLSAEVKEEMGDHVIDVLGFSLPGKPCADSIRSLQHSWLIKNGHMDNLTPGQISGASKTVEKEDHILNTGQQLF